uniref:Uncharacterized protein n=1 Tax=Myripristis murdjan TaxID=586833 RepID=A0A668A0Q4_9TELE
MLSLHRASAAGKTFLLCFSPLLLLLLLDSSGVQGASIREHRLRGSESVPERGNPHHAPDADMLKALEYIESLHQKTEDKKAEEKEGGEGNKEDKTPEWLQAVLSTLQQTEKASKPASLHSNTADLYPGEKDNIYPLVQQQHGIKAHKKHPLMFEDDAEDHDSPFKRTNENVEEKYTPQNLATLQSVFEELGRLTNAKASHKRQVEDDDEEADDEEEDGDDDVFDVRNLAYEDTAGEVADWAPLEEQENEDEEEEEKNNKHEMDRGLDYGDDEEEEGDGNDDIEDEEDDGESYSVKRSSDSGPQEDSDDIANLVDYYLLKVLEKTEEEEQKRELQEERERAERRVAQSQRRDNIDPRAIYQLIQISQKFQIPPEDLLDMLKTGETRNQGKALLRNQAQSNMGNELARLEDKLSQISSTKKHKSPEVKFFNRRLPDRQTSNNLEDRRREEILKILGLGGMGNQEPAPLRNQKQHRNSQSELYNQPGGRSGEFTPTQRRLPDKLKDDYDDSLDEDELAAYLAAQILAQYPDPAYSRKKVGQKRDDAGQNTAGSFEEAIQDYFDQMDSDKSPPQKRQSETQTQSLDDEELMMKLLSYLNPEIQENDENDVDAKTVQGM